MTMRMQLRACNNNNYCACMLEHVNFMQQIDVVQYMRSPTLKDIHE